MFELITLILLGLGISSWSSVVGWWVTARPFGRPWNWRVFMPLFLGPVMYYRWYNAH